MIARSLACLFSVLALPALAQTAQPATPGWTADPRTGCKVWNTAPEPGESLSWSGGCVNNMADGRGVLQWYENGKPGDRYEGELKGGRHSGYGTTAYANGNRYAGTWLNDKAHGQGVYTRRDGSVYDGQWVNGCFNQGGRKAVVGASLKDCGF